MQAVLSVATLPLRGYLTELILDQLSYYIRKDCLNADQLTLGGELVLHNLELKLDVLRETLAVPLAFDISRGFIRKLSVYIPWTNLFGQPIEVTFDTILIVLRSKTEAELKHTAAVTLNIPNGSNSFGKNTNGSADREAGLPSGVQGVPDGWTRAVLTKIFANASLSIRDLILKYEAPSGPTITATLRSLRYCSVNEEGVETWCEPAGDERFVHKSAHIDDISLSLSRVEHSLGGNDRPILSRTRISARTRFALNPMPRQVIDFSESDTWNPFGPHVHVDIFLPFCEVCVSHNQIEMIQTIQKNASQAEMDLGRYVEEAQKTMSAQLALQKATAKSTINEYDVEENVSAGTQPRVTCPGASGSYEDHATSDKIGWGEWAWRMIADDDIGDKDGILNESKKAFASNESTNNEDRERNSLTPNFGKQRKIEFAKCEEPKLPPRNIPECGKTVTVINFCADHLALVLLLQRDVVDKRHQNSQNNINGISPREMVGGKGQYLTPPKKRHTKQTCSSKMQVPTPRGMVEIDLETTLDSIERRLHQRSYLLPIVTVVCSQWIGELRISSSAVPQKIAVELLIEMGSFAALNGDYSEDSTSFLLCGKNAENAIDEYRSIRARSRSLSDNTPPPSPRISRNRAKCKARSSQSSKYETGNHQSASSILALSDCKISLYDEQTSIEAALGDVNLLLQPKTLDDISEFVKACKMIKSNHSASNPHKKEVKKANDDEDENTIRNSKKNHIIMSFLSFNRISVILEDATGNELIHIAAFDIHLHLGRMNSSLMIQKLQVDILPGIVLLLVQPPGLGINIIFAGVGIEAAGIDVGHVIANIEMSALKGVTSLIYENYGNFLGYKTVEAPAAHELSSTNDPISNTYPGGKGSNESFPSCLSMPSAWYLPSIGSVEISRVYMLLTTSGVSAAPIEFAPVRLSNVRRSSLLILEELQAHYTADALLSMPNVFGSIDALGNPAGFFRELRRGFSALGEGRGRAAVQNLSGAFLMPMERISRSIKNAAEGVSLGPTTGFVFSPLKSVASFFETCASKGRRVLGVDEITPRVMRPLKTRVSALHV
jgi:hypothetical protein